MFKLLHEGASGAMGYLLADDDTAEAVVIASVGHLKVAICDTDFTWVHQP